MALDKKALKALADKAAELEDQTIEVSGSFEFELPKEGKTMGRFVEYVELGKQPRPPFKGKEKPPADMVWVVFELTSPKRVKEVTSQDGTVTKIPERISLKLNKSFSEKARYKKLFEKMRYGRPGIKHMAQMLGDAFLIEIVHEKGKNDKTYANITGPDGSYLIEAPFVVDPVSETKTAVPVPAAVGEERIFIWELASKETWDTLYIPGTKTKKNADGTEVEVSKNWLQELIVGATNFEGSKIQEILAGDGEVLDKLIAASSTVEQEEETSSVEQEEEEETAEEEPKTKKKAAPAKKAAAPAKEAEDPLAALGLT